MVKKVIWVGLLVLTAVSCLDEPDCYLLNNHVLGISFRKLENSTADTVSITGVALVRDFPLTDTVDVSRLHVELNYFVDETTFYIRDLESSRMLRVGYRSQAQFVSERCGEKFVLSELQILEHEFDSVRLISDTPTREGSAIQIEIFQ